MIPPETLDEIKRAADLPALVEQSGIRLRKSGKTWTGWCPFCVKPRTAALTVYPDHFWCFRCREGGSAIDWLTKHDGYTFKDAVQWLADLTGIVIGHAPKPTPEVKARASEDDLRCRWWWARREEMVRAQLDAALAAGPPEIGSEAEEWADCCGRMLRGLSGLSLAERRRIYFEEFSGRDRTAYLRNVGNPEPDYKADILEYAGYLYQRNVDHSDSNGNWKDPDGYKDKFGPAALKRAIDTARWIPNYKGTEDAIAVILAFDCDVEGMKAALKHVGNLIDMGVSFRIPDFAGAA